MSITIPSFTLPNIHNFSGAVKLRIFYTGCSGPQFIAADTTAVMCGSQGGSWFVEVDCTVVGSDLIVAPITLYTTDDSNTSTVEASGLFVVNGARRDFLFQNWVITSTLGGTPTFAMLWLYNQQAVPSASMDSAYLTAPRVAALIAAAINGVVVPPEFVVYTSDWANLDQAVSAAILAGGGTVVVDVATPIGSSFSTTTTVNLLFVGQGRITGSSSLTIEGALDAPPQAIFDPAMTVLFTYTRELYSEWWNSAGLAATTTGSISNGSSSLTVASADGYKVGQGIYIAGAGAAGVSLVTRITAINGNVLTLANAASTLVAGALVQHDDTAAILATMAAGFTGRGAVIRLNGYYRINGPYDGTSNAILTLPNNTSANEPYAMVFEGPAPQISSENAGATRGAVWDYSDARTGAGTEPSFMAARLWVSTVGGLANFNYVEPTVRNIYMHAPPNPSLNGLNFHNAINAIIEHVKLDTDNLFSATVQPTNQRTAFMMPGVGNHAVCRFTDVYERGYYSGYRFSEHTRFDYAFASKNIAGFVPEHGYHANSGYIEVEWCPRMIDFSQVGLPTNSSNVDLVMSIERYDTAGQWWSKVASEDIYDPNAIAHGKVEYVLTLAGVGISALRLSTTIGSPENIDLVPLINGNFHTAFPVMEATQPNLLQQTQLGANRNIITSIPAAGALALNLAANAQNFDSGATWQRANTAKPSWRAFLDPGNDVFGLQHTVLGVGNITWVDILGVNANGLLWTKKGADVVSAATITPTGNLFHVTGTTNITSVSATGITAGTEITIIFDGALTFTDGSNLKLAGNFVTTADDTITLKYDGANWYEIGRSVN